MSDEVLLRFLNNGLIDVGGDDTKLEKLRETAADLSAALKKAPCKAVPFALLAFDPDAPSMDPVINEAIEALRKRWATYVNTFAGTPVAVIRAILLDALVQAANDDDDVGVAFVTCARNTLPFMEAGDERAIWGDVVGEIERKVDARAEAEWAVPSSITAQPLNFDAPPAITVQTSPGRVDKAKLHEQFSAAAGPQQHGPQGVVATANGNPHLPTAGAQWVYEFGERLADAVGEAIEAAVAEAAVGPINLAEPLQKLATAVSDHVDSTLTAVSRATAGLQRRTNLLWWKEALFSPSARLSYRELPGSAAAALMALDLYRQVPTFSPASVAAFLREAVLSLPTGADGQEKPIRELLDEVRDTESLAALRKTAAELVPAPAGRGPVLGLMGHRERRPTLDDQTFRDLVGVPARTLLSAPMWATWIFRELQAARATNDGSAMRRRARKS